MTDRRIVVLGSAVFVGSTAAVVAVLAGAAAAPVAGTAVVGLAAGAAVGYRLLPVEQVAGHLEHRLRTVGTILPMFVLIAWAAWTFVEGSSGGRFWPAMAGIFLALLGWVSVVQVGQNAQSAAADSRGETLAVLPETDSISIFGLERYRRPLKLFGAVSTLAAVGLFGWLAYTGSNPFLVVYALPVLLLTVTDTTYRVRITESGLLSENYISSRQVGTKFTAWEEVSGYSVRDGTLTIAIDKGINFSYDTGDIDDLPRVRSALEEYVPEQR
ncbi:hypothetical protein [Haloarcula salinisoli]|uniref:Uncharacterized protein n=1 Tax=Haloarcula salinisoli TaxID=2487746 RepID=A0A8J8CDV9_9EURY|nr:hypothetical protein [Halomicroarcula salinisoli]MBX0287406.1 hypothetical protein [Halomicroarcula salinisoli]MBX0305020.1 hypothetical protein [Halomicroarcula salinisoli]